MAQPLASLSVALQGRYAIERELGRGGIATVYLAEDLQLHRRVALKLLHPDLGAALGPERFLREIQIASRLTHPHILPLHDSGEADGRLFYAMPYIAGFGAEAACRIQDPLLTWAQRRSELNSSDVMTQPMPSELHQIHETRAAMARMRTDL